MSSDQLPKETPGQTADLCARSIWFPDPGFGIPDATPEELAAEPEDVKALRVLGVLRLYLEQTEHPFAAVKLGGEPLAFMRGRMWATLIDTLAEYASWQRRAAAQLSAISGDHDGEPWWQPFDEPIAQLLAEDFGDFGDEGET